MVKFSYIKVFSLFTGDFLFGEYNWKAYVKWIDWNFGWGVCAHIRLCLVLWKFICTARHVSIIAVNTCAWNKSCSLGLYGEIVCKKVTVKSLCDIDDDIWHLWKMRNTQVCLYHYTLTLCLVKLCLLCNWWIFN